MNIAETVSALMAEDMKADGFTVDQYNADPMIVTKMVEKKMFEFLRKYEHTLVVTAFSYENGMFTTKLDVLPLRKPDSVQ